MFEKAKAGGKIPRVAAVAALLLLIALPDAQAALKPGDVHGASPKLTSRLQQLGTPAVRRSSARAQAQRLSLPAEGPGSLVRAGAGVVVTARVSSTSRSAQQALRQAGATISSVSDQYQTITFAVAPSDLAAVAAVPAVRSVIPELHPMTLGLGDATNSVTCDWGSVHSEGDTQLQAAAARSAFGVDGTGVKVGIISDSFNVAAGAATSWSGDVATGDLPGPGSPCGFTTPVQDLLDAAPGGGADEGRAMAQVVHDLAPGAELGFESARTAAPLPDLVGGLRSWGANVIVDDMIWFDEPFFQEGPDELAANNAAAAGIPYFSAAGNESVTVSGNNVGSWEAPTFGGAPCPPAFDSEYSDCMDFNPGSDTSNTQAITLGPGGEFILDMQWNEPWYGVQTDLDVVLLDSPTGSALAGSADTNTGPHGSQHPFEIFKYTNAADSAKTVYLAIGKRGTAGGTPRVKYVLCDAWNITGVQFATPSGGVPTIFGHNGASGIMSIGAVPYNGTGVERFSSDGPVTHYFGPVTGPTPAAPLSIPDVLTKPDAAATDGAATTFFGGPYDDVWRFYGTSEAAPHAAAIAALQLNADPTATVDQIYTAQKSTAVPLGGFGSDAAGAGLLNAFGAVGAMNPPPLPRATTGGAAIADASTATVAGTINPNGYSTGYRFDYGLTTAYGSSTAATSAGAGLADVPVSAQLIGLATGRTYHYRVVALHGKTAAARGGDQIVTMEPLPINLAAPTISGPPTPGAVLWCSDGDWSAATSFGFQWLRDGAQVPGAAAQTFAVGNGDLWRQIACRVTAGNADGSAVATSAAVRIVDISAPRLSDAKLSPARLRSAGTGASLAASGGAGTRLSFVLSEAASITFSVERGRPGRLVSGRCRQQTRENRRSRPCTSFIAVPGAFRWNAQAGATTLRFTGRVNGRRLARGRYRLVATARDRSGNRATPARIAFTIK